jgi:hypothetical protein
MNWKRIEINHKTLLCLVLFFVCVLVFTFMDYIVNSVLYGFGLRFDAEWYGMYSAAYFLLYQLAIAMLTLASNSWRLLVFMEAFVLSSTQDLIYFSVWGKGVFPVGDWSWMPLYQTLGFYNTGLQVVLSGVSMLSATLIIWLPKKRCGCYYPDTLCWKCQTKQVLHIIKNRIKN